MKEGPLGARKPHEPSRMRLAGAVTVDDVLQALVGRTARIKSNAGQMLEAARTGIRDPDLEMQRQERARRVEIAKSLAVDATPPKLKTVRDPWRSIDRAELNVGRDVGVVRCITELEKRQYVGPRGRCALTSLQASAKNLSHGQLVVQCLLAYHEWATHSQERALAQVYTWAQGLMGRAGIDAWDLAQQFRKGESVNARKRAATLYSDALVILSAWIIRWNARQT